MNAAGRRLSESRERENLMHGLRWQVMETEITAPSLDPTPIRSAVGRIQPKPRGAIVMWNLKKGLGYEKLYIMQSWEAVKIRRLL